MRIVPKCIVACVLIIFPDPFVKAEVGVSIGTDESSPGNQRGRDLLDCTGPEFLRPDDPTSSWVSASRDGNEYVASGFLARDDHKSPYVSGIIRAEEWFVVEFENEFTADGIVFYDRNFAPYGDSPVVADTILTMRMCFARILTTAFCLN